MFSKKITDNEKIKLLDEEKLLSKYFKNSYKIILLFLNKFNQ